MTVHSKLVKMDGDFVARPAWWQWIRWCSHWLHGRQVMPKNPESHPACAEVIEQTDDQPARITYRR